MAKTAAQLRADNAALKAENRVIRRNHIATSIASIVNRAIPWAVILGIARYFYLSIGALAGKETSANILLKFLANIAISQYLAYALAGGGILYGWRQRSLRQKTVVHLQSRNQKLEAARDPQRSSSLLTERGETHPRDRE